MTKRGDYYKEGGHGWTTEDVASVMCWVLTMALIAFMLLIPWLRWAFGDGGIGWVARFVWLPLLVYFNVQLWGTSQRESSDMGQWFLDNLLALIASFIGLFLLFLPGFRHLGSEEKLTLMQCVGFSLSDLMWGLLFSQRIAFAGKERGETRI